MEAHSTSWCLQFTSSMPFREKCEYKTIYKEECADERRKVCEHFWKEDDYGGRVWVPNPDKCHWLEESECMTVPYPELVRCRIAMIAIFISRNAVKITCPQYHLGVHWLRASKQPINWRGTDQLRDGKSNHLQGQAFKQHSGWTWWLKCRPEA